MISHVRLTFFFVLLLPRALPAEEVTINAAKDFPPEAIAKVKASGAGISGPGQPVPADGNGFRIGEIGAGVRITAENRDKLATGLTVKQGLLPKIKPILDVHMRDTIVILGGDGNYYLTGSTGDNIWSYNDGIELWKSPDLIHWNYLGLVWSLDKDGGWEKKWRDRGKPVRSIWAPEIHYIHHNYFICFGMPPGGMSILKSTTGKAEGPYVHATDPNKPILGGIGPTNQSFLIDPTLFEDDDGKVYFTYGPANEIARMKDDLGDFAEPLRKVVLVDQGPYDKSVQRDPGNPFGFEGATIFKANGKYYYGATDKVHGRYSMCLAISDNIYGPYRMRHESVPCNGGSDFFKAKDGFWYTGLFGDDSSAPWRERPGIVRIDFDQDGKVIVAKQQPDFILVK